MNEELIQELKKLISQWHRESERLAISDWEVGYNVCCESRAEDLQELIDSYLVDNSESACNT